MKHLLLTILIGWIAFPSAGQTIAEVIVSAQEADEPPTKQGRPLYTLRFERNNSGELVAKSFQMNTSRRNLSQSIVIEKQRILVYNAWREANRKEFESAQLGVSRQALESKLKEADLKLGLDSTQEIVIRPDSFNFCQPFSMTKTISTGGYQLGVTVVTKAGERQIYTFDSWDIGERTFNLRHYLYAYQLIGNKLPEEFPHFNFFTEEKMEEIAVYYLQIIECEGYHYREFVKKHPERTPMENRTMKGWNFAEYMQQHKGKE